MGTPDRRGPGRPPGAKNKPKDPVIESQRDTTIAMFPGDVPLNEDGSIATDVDIDVETARKIGAVTPDAARHNHSLLQKFQDKRNGERYIRWGEDRAEVLCEIVRETSPASSVTVHVTRIDPPPQCPYPLFYLDATKDAKSFYDYILRNFHKNSRETEYKVEFRVRAMMRGAATLRIPDMSHLSPDAFNNLAPAYQPPPPPYAGNLSQVPQPTHYPNYPPPQPQQYPAPPQYPPQASPFQVPEPVRDAETMKVAPYSPPVATPPQQQGQDPMMMAIFEEMRRMQQMMQNQQLQTERALGAIDEMKRNPPPVQTYQTPESMIGLGMFPGQNPYLTSASPPHFATNQTVATSMVPQQNLSPYQQAAMAPPPVAAVAPDPMLELQKATSLITGMTKAMGAMRAAMAHIPGMVVEDEGDDEPQAAQPNPMMPQMPFQTVPIGAGPNAPMYAFNPEDGSPHLFGTLLANAPRITEAVQSIKGTVMEIRQQEAAQQEAIQRQRLAAYRAQQAAAMAPPPAAPQLPEVPQVPRFIPPNAEPVEQSPSSPNQSFLPSYESMLQAAG